MASPSTSILATEAVVPFVDVPWVLGAAGRGPTGASGMAEIDAASPAAPCLTGGTPSSTYHTNVSGEESDNYGALLSFQTNSTQWSESRQPWMLSGQQAV